MFNRFLEIIKDATIKKINPKMLKIIFEKLHCKRIVSIIAGG